MIMDHICSLLSCKQLQLILAECDACSPHTAVLYRFVCVYVCVWVCVCVCVCVFIWLYVRDVFNWKNNK